MNTTFGSADDTARGNASEEAFRNLAIKNGFSVVKSTVEDDRHRHFDFIITKNTPLRIEVKGLKRFPILNNDRTTNHFLLIEWANVNGKQGWIFGDADLIAFEREDGFMLIPRRHLMEVAKKLCKDGKNVARREEMLYNYYTRDGRDDRVSAIMIDDIVATRQFKFWRK